MEFVDVHTTSASDLLNNNDDFESELELLVDPSKSRPSSPQQQEPSPNFVRNISTDDKKSPIMFMKDDDDVPFKMNIEQEKIFKPISTPIDFEKVKSVPISTDSSREKQELLFKLKRLEAKGIPLSKSYSRNSSLHEMRDEYERIKAQRDLQNSIKFQRKTLVAATSGTEFLNKRFDPFNLKLTGWSESVSENIDDYDEVFEELHEKYNTKSTMPPEMKLLLMVGGSAAMFHMSQKMFANATPDVNDIMRQNPDLAKQFAAAAVNQHLNAPNTPNIPPPSESSNFIPPAQPSNTPNPPVMQGPSDAEIESLLSSINAESDSKDPPATVVAEAPPKKRRGRPRKTKPDVKSFSLNI
jgi:hypothetical protein